ncbi:hypothetical protein LTS08_004575 [Lithohypha guttulata]|nr:hypothetical protein LTS08_004575 [Lithohypha guttulata]
MADCPSDETTSTEITISTSTKSRRGLRKSCHFCRARKIRCSGDTICDACKERNLECSYNEGEPKGRPKITQRQSAPDGPPRRSLHKNARSESVDFRYDQLDSLTNDPFISFTNQQPFAPPSSSSSNGNASYTRSEWQDPGSIAAQLSNAFSWTNENFRQAAGKPTAAVDKKVTIISDHIARHGNAIVDIPQDGRFDHDLSYEDIFFTISQELIELLALRLGELGCSQINHDRSHYFVKCFMIESNTTMFDISMDSQSSFEGPGKSISALRDPFMAYDNQAIPQLLEMWFSQHPFSFMISKTLLLREIRQETYDPILVAVMIADVESAGNTAASQTRSQTLYTWARLHLGKTEKSKVQLTTIQAIGLLGWHALCTGQARRALVFLSWADSQMSSVGILDRGINIVNGVDIGTIEAETFKSTQWLLFSIFLWILMQTRMSTRDLLPWDAPASLPVADANDLAMLQLDRASGWFSTLQSQEAAYNELWMLSYISAFVSQIYKICPRVLPLLPPVEQDKVDWRSDLWRRLRGLSDPMEDNVLICTQVRHLLHDLIQTSPLQCGQDSDARALELSVIHTILIHLLLPASINVTSGGKNTLSQQFEIDAGGGRRILAAGGIDKLTDEYCNSARTLHQLFTALQQKHLGSRTPSRITMSQRRSTKGYIILLGLDACVRGLYSLWGLGRTGSDFERQYLATRQGELQALALDLHSFARPLNCSEGARLSAIVEKLEIIMCYFCGVEMEDYSNPGDSSNCSSANNSTRSRTPPASDMALTGNLLPHLQSFNANDPLAIDFVSQHTHQVFDIL